MFMWDMQGGVIRYGLQEITISFSGGLAFTLYPLRHHVDAKRKVFALLIGIHIKVAKVFFQLLVVVTFTYKM